MHPEQAEDQLALIRATMERTARFTGLPGYACFVAGSLAVAGAATAASLGADFPAASGDHSRSLVLGVVWGSVCLAGGAQFVVLSALAAARQRRPAWSGLARRVVVAVLPGLYMGAALTEFARRSGRIDVLPAFWCLAYGVSLLGLGLYAGWKANVTGLLFLAAGTLALLGAAPGGNLLMAITFGGFHFLLGILIFAGHDHAAEDRNV